MKTKNEEAEGLKRLFINELKVIYWCEKVLVKSIPRISKKATDPDLVQALKNHLSETNDEMKRLENIFDSISIKPLIKKSSTMADMIEEAEAMISEAEKGPMRDACIILAIQKIEHYEIATYGTLLSFANRLKLPEAVDLLKKSLDEEKNADKALTDIAESGINEQAVVDITGERIVSLDGQEEKTRYSL